MSPRGNPLEKAFRLVMSDEEHEALMTMATEDGLSAAAWLRQLIRREQTKRARAQRPGAAKLKRK